ncbi:MAG: hypothetical protein ACREGI_05610 [Candidatus Levyibacteriota bacterium]
MTGPEDEGQLGRQQEQTGGDPLEQFLAEFRPAISKATKANKPLFQLVYDLMIAAAQRDRLVGQLPEATTYAEALQRPQPFFYITQGEDVQEDVFTANRAVGKKRIKMFRGEFADCFKKGHMRIAFFKEKFYLVSKKRIVHITFLPRVQGVKILRLHCHCFGDIQMV